MNIHFLDVVASGTLELGLFIILIAITLVEAIVLLLFKLNGFFKCLLDSFIANLVSWGLGYLITYVAYDVSFDSGATGWITAFILSILVEALVVKLMNNKKLTYGKVLLPVTVMNVVSYLGIIGWLASI